MKIIVSLTTTYEREQAGLLYKSINSLLKQDNQPDIVMLNISEEPYLKDSGFSEIPQWLKDLNVTINWVKNTGPYRKLLPTLQLAGKDDLIVTADDDIVYGKFWLKRLIEVYRENPGTIVCCRARKMKRNFYGEWQNYRNWPLLKSKSCGLCILPTGGGGVVYSKEKLDSNFLFDQKYLELSPTSDDLWFKMASMLKKIPTLVCPEIDRENFYLKHAQGLDRENFIKIKTKNRLKKFAQRQVVKIKNYLGVNQTRNDMAWDRICSYSSFYENLTN